MAPLDQMTEVLHAEVARFPRARLTVTKGPDKGQEVVLEGQTVVVGTDESCQLKLADTSVSRLHAYVRRDGANWVIADAGSKNGSWLRGERLEPRRERVVASRSELRFGDVDVTLYLAADLFAALGGT